MAVCSQSPTEFLQGVFCPTIAVTCSEDAEQVCMKNKLSFVEMTRPFCQLTTEAHIRDPSGAVHTVKNWKLRLLEMSAPHPPHHVVNKLLHEVVARTQPVNTDPSTYSPEHQAKASTPWFEAYRDCFLQLLKPSDHEFIRHFLSCVFVVSSHHSDPMNAFATMTSQLLDQQQTNSHIKWFSTGVFRYYVLLHDVNDAVESKAEAVYQSMKSVYGLHACHMLMVNSVNPVAAAQMPNLPDPWSQFIIPASNESLDWDEEVDPSMEATEEDPLNCAVDENFDPEAVIADNEEQKARSGSGSGILIGPLTLDDNPDEPETQDLINDQSMKSSAELSNSHEKKHLAGQYRYFSSRKFTSAVRSQSVQRTHGLCLSLSDQDRIKIFIHELAFRGLLPYIERMMKNLYDQIMARKGIHRSIFSATKKWFSGGKPAGLASGLVPGIIYANDSPELYHRKLGDLAFLVQNYELAYNCYHTAKRDFNSEHAWFYFAGALEMAAISAFLASLQRPYPSHYMETAISTYLTACRQHMFAVRASLLSTEVLKAKNMSLDAAMQFMKMTGEEPDLLCALLLEQSAHCFLHCNPVMARKYAFNMILAGHRFSKSAQRKHALRCYRQALHVYEDKSWHLAEDHINFTLGRQSFNLRQLDDALKSFRQLLVYESKQSPQQQAAYLREFLFVFKQLLEAKDKSKAKTRTLPYLPLPVVDSNATRTILSFNQSSQKNTTTNSNPSTPKDGLQDPFGLSLFGETETKSNPDNVILIGQASFEEKYDMELEKRWKDMEEELYESVNITPVPPFFRTHVHCLSSRTNNKMKPLCVINETVAVEVIFYNPLKIPLNLTNLMLLWEFTPQDKNSPVVNQFKSHEDLVKTEIISKFAIEGGEKEAAHLTLTPCCTGALHIKGVKYSLSSIAIGGPVEDSFNTTEAHPAVSAVSMLGKLDLDVRGPRLNHTKEEKTSVIYGQDHRLNMVVVPAMPLLEVRFRNFPTNLLCGEVVRTTAEFTNAGQCSLSKLFMASSTPEFFTIGTQSNEKDAKKIYQTFSSEHSTLENPLSEIRRITEVPIPGGCLAPGVSVKLPVWVQGAEEDGSHSRELKFYYESTDKNPKMSHRALQHAFSVDFSSSLVVRATARRSKNCRNLQEKLGTKEQLIVALDIENLMQGATANKFGEFSVIQVSCVSKRWRLQPLSHCKTDGLLCVRPGETIVTQFKATKYTDKEGDSLGFSHVAFSDEMINTSATPAVDFFFRSRTWREMYESNCSTNSSCTVDTTKVDLGLIVFWKASFIDEKFVKKTVMGQSHVAISRLAESVSALQPVPQSVGTPVALPISSPSASIDNKELLIQYLLNHKSRIRQDFKHNRLIIIPIELTLNNCCQEVVNVFVERTASETPSSIVTQNTGEPVSSKLEVETDSGHRPSTTSFVLIGQTSRRLRLEPYSTSILKFNAMISLPGVYNLNQLRVYAAVDENNHTDVDFDLSKMVLQKPSPPSFLEVEDSSSEFVGSTDKQNSLDNS